jgi:hypothetical protein
LAVSYLRLLKQGTAQHPSFFSGWLVYFKDTEGNVSGMVQRDPSVK